MSDQKAIPTAERIAFLREMITVRGEKYWGEAFADASVLFAALDEAQTERDEARDELNQTVRLLSQLHAQHESEIRRADRAEARIAELEKSVKINERHGRSSRGSIRMTPEEIAVAAVPLVGQVVTAVHEHDPDEIARLIHGAHPAALEAALVIACAMVDDAKSFAQLLAWADLPDNTIDPADWTHEEIEAAHQLYDDGNRSKSVTLGQIIWRRRQEHAA